MLVELTPATVLVYVVVAAVAAIVIYRFRGLLLRGIPDLSPTGMGLFRIAWGLALFYGMAVELRLPDAAAPGGSEAEAALWAPWPWVDYLASHWNVRDALQLATLAAIVAFTIGLRGRLAYALVVAGFIVRLLVAQEYGVVSHAWVVYPFVLLPLALVPWSDGLSVDNCLRARRGAPVPERPPGPRYGIAVWLPGFVLGCVWAAAAAAKLGRSGIEWVTDGAVRYHWAEDHLAAPTSWGGWVAGHEPVAVALSAAGLAVEALFITHVAFRSQWVRLAYGLAALSLFAGFYVFQGVFWYAWWTLLLALGPWEAIAGRIRSRGRAAASEPSGVDARLSVTLAAVVAALAVQQFAISRAGVEQMPFFSNYPMYSGTWESPAAFNAGMAPTKFYRYDFVAGGADVTGRREQAGARAALQEAARLHVVAPDQPLDQSARQAVVAAGDLYEQRFGTELERVRVVTHPRIFDFDHGGLIDAPPPPPATLELATGEFD